MDCSGLPCELSPGCGGGSWTEHRPGAVWLLRSDTALTRRQVYHVPYGKSSGELRAPISGLTYSNLMTRTNTANRAAINSRRQLESHTDRVESREEWHPGHVVPAPYEFLLQLKIPE